MQLKAHINYFWILLFTFSVNIVSAQISVSNHSFVDTTEYVSFTDGEHLIYGFTPKRGDVPANVDLSSNFESATTHNYKWLKLNETTFEFDSLHMDLDVVSSEYLVEGNATSDEKGGCYKLEVTGNGIDTAFFAWIYMCDFLITDIEILMSTCTEMELATDLDIDNGGFEYYDLLDFSPLNLEHKIADDGILWETIPEGVISAQTLNPNFQAPTEYVRFNLTLTDNFGQKTSDYLDLEEYELDDVDGNKWLRAVKPDFVASRAFNPQGETDSTGQPPFTVQFENLSENAVEYKWTFYNDSTWYEEGLLDTVLYATDAEIPEDSITYYYPSYYNGIDDFKDRTAGMYTVKLETWGPWYYTTRGEQVRCRTEKIKYKYIQVDRTFMPDFVNVFTPDNGDEINNIFTFSKDSGSESGGDGGGEETPKKDGITDSDVDDQFSSIKSFSIKIYTRWGDKVHEYSGNIEDWEGWDGKTDLNRPAKPGVYFYSAFVQGWDGKAHNRKGFVHLFR